MKFTFIIAALCAGVLLASGCNAKKENSPAENASQDTLDVKTITVQPDTFVEYGTYYGRLAPIQEAKLICYTGGRVEALKAEEGDFVKSGASLACIDSAKATTLLRTAELQEKIAAKNLAQTKKHLSEGNASQIAVDQAELAFLLAKNSNIDAQKNFKGALAISPLSGLITFRSVNLYQEVPPGFPTFSISQTSTMKVFISIVESEALEVNTGSKAEISASLHPNTLWYGTVKSVAREASSDSRTFRTEIHINNANGTLKPGATAKVKLELRRHTDALCIPTELIRTDGVQNSIMVVTSDNHASRRIIEPGPQSDSFTLIKSGLSAGDRIISSGYQLALDGMPVHAQDTTGN